jgi:hypothetical protein
MEIQDLGAIGEFVSSVAIVITLIFLALETRRSRTATQQSNRQARQRIRTDHSLGIAFNPEFAEVFATAIGESTDPTGILSISNDLGLSTVQGLQMYSFSISFMRYLEDQFFSDLPETDRFALEGQVKVVTGNHYMTKLWERAKGDFHPRFQEYLDARIQ